VSVSSVGGSSAQFDPSIHRRHHHPPMDNTAKLLGMSTDDLEQAQKSGKTLSDLATEKGVSRDDLISSITEDLKAGKPSGAPDLSADQLTEMAGNIADGKRPSGPRRPDGTTAASGSAGDRAQSNLDSLAEELGVDSGSLLDALNSDGFDAGSLLNGSGYGSSSSSLSGLSIDKYA
jgi:uncharacterized protein YidB (DUF937 family)